MVITGTTGNRVYPKRVPRVQIPPAPPEKNTPSDRMGCSFFKKEGFELLYARVQQTVSRWVGSQRHNDETNLSCSVIKMLKNMATDKLWVRIEIETIMWYNQ